MSSRAVGAAILYIQTQSDSLEPFPIMATVRSYPNPVEQTTDSPTAHFILIEPKPNEGINKAPLVEAWQEAISLYFSKDTNPPFTVLEGKLQELDAELLECDCMVSPANSFGVMDGGSVLSSLSFVL